MKTLGVPNGHLHMCWEALQSSVRFRPNWTISWVPVSVFPLQVWFIVSGFQGVDPSRAGPSSAGVPSYWRERISSPLGNDICKSVQHRDCLKGSLRMTYFTSRSTLTCILSFFPSVASAGISSPYFILCQSFDVTVGWWSSIWHFSVLLAVEWICSRVFAQIFGEFNLVQSAKLAPEWLMWISHLWLLAHMICCLW